MLDFWRLRGLQDNEKTTYIEGAGPDAWRPVKMTPQLMEKFASRTIDGYKVDWKWKLNSDGWWSPEATIDFEDKLLDIEAC